MPQSFRAPTPFTGDGGPAKPGSSTDKGAETNPVKTQKDKKEKKVPKAKTPEQEAKTVSWHYW